MEILRYRLDNDLSNSIVCVTETWLNSNYANPLLCNNCQFSVFRLDRDSFSVRKKCGGGLLILVPSFLNARFFRDPYCEDGFESICVDLALPVQKRRKIVRLCLVYRAPEFFNCPKARRFCSHISSVISDKIPFLLLGDFNMPSIDWNRSCVVNRGPDSLESQFLQLSLEQRLSQLVNEPTRGDNTLDLVFSTEPYLVSSISVDVPLGGSDHRSVQFSSELSIHSGHCHFSKRYNFRKADFQAIAQALDHVDWPSIFETCSDVQQMWDSFLGVLRPLIKQFVPLRKLGKSDQKWSQKVHQLFLMQKVLHRSYKKNPSAEAFQKWKTVAKEFRVAVRQEKANREAEVLHNRNDNQFWQHVNSRLKCRAKLPDIQREDGTFSETDFEKVCIINDYFGSVFQKDRTAKLQVQKEEIRPTSVVKFPPEIVYSYLCQTPAKYSSGPDGLPSILFKELAFQLAQPLSSIFEVSFNTGTLPLDWLKSLVTPIHKKGSRSIPSNYRPVSLTCVACRVMERIIKEVIVQHLSRNRLISKSQHGFLSRHSTVTQLLQTLNDLTQAVDEKEAVDVAYADVSKAFDRLPHSKILESFGAYRIEGNLLSWLKAFLSNRTQCVVYNGCQSNEVAATSGIPQGSVLGPVCFLAVINRLPKVIKHSTVKLFADDCKLYFRVRTNLDWQCFSDDLFSLFQWASDNGLTLALAKTAIMHIGYRNPQFRYFVQGTHLDEVDSVRDLGIQFSSTLKFSDHVSLIVKKAITHVNMIYLAFYSKNLVFLTQMFKTFVRPVLEYASPVWSPYLHKDIDALEKVQIYFTRRLPGISGSYPQRLEFLKSKSIDLEILELRRIQSDLIEVFKIVNGLCALEFAEFFQWSPATMVRGHSLRILRPRSQLDSRHYFFCVRVIPYWNCLSEETVTAHSLAIFKRRVQTVERGKLLPFLRGSV